MTNVARTWTQHLPAFTGMPAFPRVRPAYASASNVDQLERG